MSATSHSIFAKEKTTNIEGVNSLSNLLPIYLDIRTSKPDIEYSDRFMIDPLTYSPSTLIPKTLRDLGIESQMVLKTMHDVIENQ